jgi:hypothetical protein
MSPSRSTPLRKSFAIESFAITGNIPVGGRDYSTA